MKFEKLLSIPYKNLRTFPKRKPSPQELVFFMIETCVAYRYNSVRLVKISILK